MQQRGEVQTLTAFRSWLPERFKAAQIAGRGDRYVAAIVLYLSSCFVPQNELCSFDVFDFELARRRGLISVEMCLMPQYFLSGNGLSPDRKYSLPMPRVP